MEEPTTWLGLDLTPLPDESIFCILARLQWMNVLTLHDLRPFTKGYLGGSVPFYGRDESDLRGRVAEATGWFTSSAVPFFSKLDETFMRAWFEPGLVICPQCAQGFYHSNWHQLRGLQCCPIHGCPLLTQCPECRHAFDTYQFEDVLFHRPFCCPSCGAPLGGRPPSWSTITAFRKQHPDLRRQWGPWRRWAQGLGVRLRWCAKYATSLEVSRLERWWSLAELVQALTYQFHASPPLCDWQKPNITWLVWPTDAPTKFHPHNPYPMTAQWNLSTNPYLGVLNELREWINATCPLPTQSPSPEIFDAEGRLIKDGWSPAALAYMVMRKSWESTDTWSPAAALRCTVSPLRRLELPRKFLVDCAPLTARALFLAVFAALYWKIQRSDVLDMSSCGIDDASAACVSSEATRPNFCILCFPTVPGMPLRGFSPSPLRLDDARELLWYATTRDRRGRNRLY